VLLLRGVDHRGEASFFSFLFLFSFQVVCILNVFCDILLVQRLGVIGIFIILLYFLCKKRTPSYSYLLYDYVNMLCICELLIYILIYASQLII
jgi:hypothetical protein